MPVRARLRAQPTLAAGSPLSFAIAMMWHCGLPSMRSVGKASFSVMSASAETRSSTTSGSIGDVRERAVHDREPAARRTCGIAATAAWSTQPASSTAATSSFAAASASVRNPCV